MTSWLPLLLVTLSAATLLMAAVLLRSAGRSRDLGGASLAVLLLLLGLFFALNAASSLGAGWIPVDQLVVLGPLGMGAIVAFGITFPAVVLERGHVVALALTGLSSVGLAAWVLADPSASGTLQSLMPASFLIVLLLLGSRWLASSPGDHRQRITWGLIPFVFYALHDGLGFVYLPVLFGSQTLEGFLRDPWLVMELAEATLLVLGALCLAGIALARVVRGPPTADERALAFVTLYLLPVTLLQVLDPTLHVLLDFLFVGLIAYGVARYSIVDLDLRLKWGLEKSTVLGVFGVSFLVVSEAVEALLAVDGIFFGVGAAVAIGLVFRRVEQAAGTVADRLMPGIEDSPEYLDGRRATIYRAQAESLLADGEASQKERGALDRLQVELGLDGSEAERIEADVLGSS